MMERMQMIYRPPSYGKLRTEQIAQQSTWDRIPEGDRQVASMHVLHFNTDNGYTEITVNPTDPGDGCVYDTPGAKGTVVPAGRMRY